MNKKSAAISGIKNGIFSIIYKLQNRNTEPDVTEEKEQTVDSEPISRSENETETLAPDKKELIELKTELGESIDAILNRLFDRISDVLEKDYEDRLEGLERSIEELKKGGGKKVAPGFITSEEELTGIIEKIAERVSIDTLPGILKEIEKAPLEKIRKMGDMGVNDFSDTELEKYGLFMRIASSLSENVKEISEPNKRTVQLTDHSHPVIDPSLMDDLKKCRDEINKIHIQLSYNKGVKLLKEGDFESAYECFDEITRCNPDNFKGAWLNRGFALGKLGDVNREIESYENALNIDKDKCYEKAGHNKKIAERKRWIKKKWKKLQRRMSFF